MASLCELASDDAAKNRKDHQKAAKLLDVGVDVCTQAEKECHKRALYDKENDFRDKRLGLSAKKAQLIGNSSDTGASLRRE